MNGFLSEGIKLVRLSNAAAAGTTTITGTAARAGFNRCFIFAALGDVTDTSVLTLTGKSGNESDASDAVAISGAVATFTAGASDADNKELAVDVALNDDDYVTVTLARGTANAVVNGIFAIFYDSRIMPQLNSDLLAAVGRGVAL